MEPTLSVAFMRQMLESCEKRAEEARRTTSVGLETLHPGQKHVRPCSFLGGSWSSLRERPSPGVMQVPPHTPSEQERSPARRGMEYEDVSLFLVSPSVGCKLTA